LPVPIILPITCKTAISRFSTHVQQCPFINITIKDLSSRSYVMVISVFSFFFLTLHFFSRKNSLELLLKTTYMIIIYIYIYFFNIKSLFYMHYDANIHVFEHVFSGVNYYFCECF
jgi:hypothetical protein